MNIQTQSLLSLAFDPIRSTYAIQRITETDPHFRMNIATRIVGRLCDLVMSF